MGARICARCGRTVSATIRGLCRECFTEVYSIGRLPRQVNMVICKYCGSIRVKGTWGSPTETSIETAILDTLFSLLTEKLRPSEGLDYAWIDDVKLASGLHGPGLYNILVSIKGVAGELTVEENRVIRLKLDVGVCPSCTNRITKRGYDAIIQVRSSSGRLSKEQIESLNRVIEKLDSGLRSSIISIEEGKNGVDLLVDEVSTARVIASKIRMAMLGKVSEAYKLVGRRSDGKRKGRLTIAVRIPDIRPGDVIVVGTSRYLVFGFGRSGVTVINMETGAEETLGLDALWGKGFHRDSSIVTSDMLLLYKGNDAILFSDPEKPEEIIEYPRSDVKFLVDRLEEGAMYRAIRYGKLIYVIEALDRGGE